MGKTNPLHETLRSGPMKTPETLASVCVFCGARPGLDPAFSLAATETGTMLAKAGWRLVYGAGDIGLMGAVADAAAKAGGARLGVIPQHLIAREAAQGTAPTEAIITETMHERKKVMFANSDAIVVLPGGAGTLDEFFEVLTWAQIGLHGKPIVLVDVEGYWAPLVALIEQVIAAGFAAAGLRELFTVVPNVAQLEVALRARLNGRAG
jgi:uncharacterized protein (TIGR00730 family)